jgi:hypothetical protein
MLMTAHIAVTIPVSMVTWVLKKLTPNSRTTTWWNLTSYDPIDYIVSEMKARPLLHLTKK